MTRIKRGYIARRRRKEIRLFVSSFRGTHSKLPIPTYLSGVYLRIFS